MFTSAMPLETDVSPHAIFWRPLTYFSVRLHDGQDALDSYRSITYRVSNRIIFDLRTYRGHPQYTVTLYLPFDIDDEDDIRFAVFTLITATALPQSAVAWRRPWSFELGKLERPLGDRLRESEARILALKIALASPNRSVSTEELKRQIPNYYPLSPIDLQWSTTRRGERLWQQVVGNVVSHRSSGASPFRQGYAVRTSDGLRLTPRGVNYLKSLGFSDDA